MQPKFHHFPNAVPGSTFVAVANGRGAYGGSREQALEKLRRNTDTFSVRRTPKLAAAHTATHHDDDAPADSGFSDYLRRLNGDESSGEYDSADGFDYFGQFSDR